MKNLQRHMVQLMKGSVLLGLLSFTTGCIVAQPREGYYDRDHHRYYHERTWHQCRDHDEYCR